MNFFEIIGRLYVELNVISQELEKTRKELADAKKQIEELQAQSSEKAEKKVAES